MKAGHSTSGSSSSDSIPDPRVGTRTVANAEGPGVASNPYEMHIIVQPPHQARSGHVLTPPTTISLRSSGASQAGQGLGGNINNYWAFVSVVSEDGMVALAPPSTTLLSGALADSVHEDRLTDSGQGIGHCAFPNLTINQAGDFRLRISLLRMPTGQGGPSAGSLDTSVRNVASVLSHVIHVHDNASAQRLG